MSSIKVAPSILSADFGNLSQEVQSIANAGADWVHVDVMDGKFVPPITFGPLAVKVVKQSCSLTCDVHLMIESPENQIAAFADAGTDVLSVHIEACTHIHKVLLDIKKRNMKAGLALNPGTSIESTFPILDLCDQVLVMTVNPGWGGQSFIESSLKKIDQLKNEIVRRNLKVDIEVDGGINNNTAAACVQAGANILVSGSYVFNAKDRKAAVTALHES